LDSMPSNEAERMEAGMQALQKIISYKEVNMTEEKKEMAEVVVAPPEIIATTETGGLDIVQTVDRLEKSISAYQRIKELALKLTRPEDWVDMGGKPYLLESGAQKIAKAFGVEIFDVSLEQKIFTDDRGSYSVFVAKGKARSKILGSYVEDIGTCSQRDKFFGMEKGQFKQLEDVDITVVMKKAVTNLFGRLIDRAIGLGGTNWKELEALGIKPSAKIEYKQTSQAAKEVGKMILDMAGGDTTAASKMLQEFTRFKGKDGKEVSISSVAQLSEVWAQKILPKVQKAYDEWKNLGSEPLLVEGEEK